MKKRISKKGMTLVELIVYISITMIMSILIIELILRFGSMQKQSRQGTEIVYNEQRITDRLKLVAAEATSLVGSYPSNTLSLLINGEQVPLTLNDGKLFYQGQALTNSTVTISPLDGEDFIFHQVVNGTSSSIQYKFKITSNASGAVKDFQSAIAILSY